MDFVQIFEDGYRDYIDIASQGILIVHSNNSY